jgi:arabinofuranosyltransferase
VKPRLLIPFLLVALALVGRFIPGERTIDDAYITFRYARNLLAGEGFVFNPGERVQGTTTPLYALLMAGVGALTGGTRAPFATNALVVNALADAATCLLLWRLGKRLGAELPGVAAGVIWAVAPYSVTFAIGGLETSVYVLLLTGMVAAYLARRYSLTALCAALALLTRPDAVLLVAPLILDRLYCAWREDKKEEQPAARPYLGWQELLAFLLPCLAWAIFATLYFGSPIPHSVQAKLQVYRLGENASLIRLMQHYATPFFQHNLLGPIAGIALGLIANPFFYWIGARHAWKIEPRVLTFLIYPWLYLIVFALPNPLLFRWYLTPPLPAYFLFILMGAEQLVRAIFRRGRETPPLHGVLPSPLKGEGQGMRVILLLFVLILPLATTLSEWRLRPDHGAVRPTPDMAWIKLELLYRQAADILAPRMDASTLLAAGDVGVLGFYTPARILDTVGLNSPQSLRYYPLAEDDYVINYAIPSDLILDASPDYIAILEVYARRTLLVDERFQLGYRLLNSLPTDIYGSQGLLIFARTDK